MPRVKFNAVEEFCAEMERDKSDIDRRIVRLTHLFQDSRLSPNIQHVLAVATYSVKGQVVRLERYCGDVWRINDEADKKVLDRAEAVHKAIKEACQRLELKVRAGILEE